MTTRTMRRWRRRYQQYGVSGLQDLRRVDRSPHGVPEAEVKRWLRLYRERYHGFNVRAEAGAGLAAEEVPAAGALRLHQSRRLQGPAYDRLGPHAALVAPHPRVEVDAGPQPDPYDTTTIEIAALTAGASYTLSAWWDVGAVFCPVPTRQPTSPSR